MHILMMPDYRRDNPYQRLLADALHHRGVDVRFPSGYRRIFPIWREIRGQSPAVDIIHLHWLTPYLKGANHLTFAVYCLKLIIDLLLVKLSGIPIVWTVHNQVSHESKWPWLEQYVQRWATRIVAVTIFHSQAATKQMAVFRESRRSSVAVIPHGHYREVYGPRVDVLTARRKIGLPENGKIIMFFGSMRPYKGVERLVQSWRILQERTSDVTLVIAGSPLNAAYEEHLRQIVSGAQQIVFRAARIPDDEVSLYFSAADGIVLPFEHSLTSGSLLLAMSYGKIVIAPQLPYIRETLGDYHSILYDQLQPGALSEALEYFVAGAIQIEGIGILPNSLDWDDIALKTRDVYMKALAGC